MTHLCVVFVSTVVDASPLDRTAQLSSKYMDLNIDEADMAYW